MEGNIATLCSWNDVNKNNDFIEMNLLNSCDQQATHSTMYKRQISPASSKISLDQQIERNKMVMSLEKTFHESQRKFDGGSGISLHDKIKKEFLKDSVDSSTVRTLSSKPNNTNIPLESFHGSINMENFENLMTHTRPNFNQYHDFKPQEVDNSLLSHSQSHYLMKPENFMRNSHSQQKHSVLPSLSQYPYPQYSQTMPCPSSLPSLPAHVFSMPRFPLNYPYHNVGSASFNAASLISNPTIASNQISSNMNFLPFNGNFFPSHSYGTQHCPLTSMNLNALNMPFQSSGGLPYPHSMYEKTTCVKDETDEDERRKANQRRRKAESRKRLRERDPVGYREKEAKARRDRRMKQKARLQEKKNGDLLTANDEGKKADAHNDTNTAKGEFKVDIKVECSRSVSPEGGSSEPITDDEVNSEENCSSQKNVKLNQSCDKRETSSKNSHTPKSTSSTTSETTSSKDDDATSGSSEYATSVESTGP